MHFSFYCLAFQHLHYFENVSAIVHIWMGLVGNRKGNFSCHVDIDKIAHHIFKKKVLMIEFAKI